MGTASLRSPTPLVCFRYGAIYPGHARYVRTLGYGAKTPSASCAISYIIAFFPCFPVCICKVANHLLAQFWKIV